MHEVRGKSRSERVEAHFLNRGLFAVTVRRLGSSKRKNLFGTEGLMTARRGCHRLLASRSHGHPLVLSLPL